MKLSSSFLACIFNTPQHCTSTGSSKNGSFEPSQLFQMVWGCCSTSWHWGVPVVSSSPLRVGLTGCF